MTTDEREVKRKLRILNHVEEMGNIAKICRYFGIPRSFVLCMAKYLSAAWIRRIEAQKAYA